MAHRLRDTIFYDVYLDGKPADFCVCGYNKTEAWRDQGEDQFRLRHPGVSMPARRRFKLVQESRNVGTG